MCIADQRRWRIRYGARRGLLDAIPLRGPTLSLITMVDFATPSSDGRLRTRMEVP
jgi:hypothetical protein